jgi:NAD-dependent DNA ligase
MYGDRAEAEVLRELRRLGIENAPMPDVCPKCGGKLKTSSGYVGEMLLYCPNRKCKAGIVWEDSEDAIRRVF